jgi:outer membrane protein OmpA-like peptidoglycan-associated protein
MAQNPDAGLVMIACNAGAYDDGLAQQVADHLERPVHAAAGKVYIEDYQSPPRPWISQTPSGATGEFITVQPRLGQETEVSFHEGGVEMPADQQRVIERFASRAADAARRAGTDPKQKPVITVVGYASGRRGDSDGLDTGQKRAEAVTAWLQQSLRHRLGEGRLDDVVTVTVSRGEDQTQSVLDTGRDRSSLLRRATITLHTPTLRDNDESDEDEDLEPLAFNAGPAGPSGSSRRRSVERSADRVPTTRTPAVPRPSAQSVTDQLGRMDLDRTSRSVGQGNEGAGTQTYPLVDSAVAERWRATFSSARRTLRDLADQQQLVERAAQIVAGHHVPPPGQHSPLPANARAYQDLYGNVVYAVAAQLHADRHHPQPYHRATSLAQQAAAEFRTAPPAHRSDPAPPDAGASRPSTSRHQARQRSSNDARYR